MAEEKKSATRSKPRGGLFGGPSDPLGGMARPRRRKAAATASVAREPSTAKLSPSAAPELPPPSIAPPAPPQAAPQAVLPPRPAGMRITSGPTAPVEPDLSPLPASMRLRMAKARIEGEARARAEEAARVQAEEAARAEESAQVEAAQVDDAAQVEAARAEEAARAAQAEAATLREAARVESARAHELRAHEAARAEEVRVEEAARADDAARADEAAREEPAEHVFMDAGRARITLPPSFERGTAPVFDDSEDSYDLFSEQEQEPEQEHGGLMGLVPEEEHASETAGFVVAEQPPPRFGGPELPEDVDASAWDDPQTDHNALFDIQPRGPEFQEDLEEPPSELIGLAQLPRGGVIVRDERVADGFTHRVSPEPLSEDAGVWSVEDTPSSSPTKRPAAKAWWEERTDDPPSASKLISGLPRPDRESVPSFLGKTRVDREMAQRKKMARLGGGATLFILVIIAIFVWLSQSVRPDPVHQPAMVQPIHAPPSQPTPGPVIELPPLPEPAPESVEPPVVEYNPEAELGFLNIRSEPRAVISIGRSKLGDSPIERLELPPGTYTIRAMRPGKRTKTRTVRVDAGRAQEIVFRW